MQTETKFNKSRLSKAAIDTLTKVTQISQYAVLVRLNNIIVGWLYPFKKL